MKPEEYLQAQTFAPSPEDARAKELTSAEEAFISKYVGEGAMSALGVEADEDSDARAAERTRDEAGEPSLPERLKAASSVQMVAFYLDDQVYLIPTMAVNEVLRYTPPVLLPMAPDYVAGVINLRGRVTPLIYLEYLLTEPKKAGNENRFIIICTYKGLQVGLIFDKVHTMYTFSREQIMWDVESRIGASAEYICGLVEVEGNILGIVSVDTIIDKVLKD
jgi:purine-binding chemotaxis protein CheW